MSQRFKMVCAFIFIAVLSAGLSYSFLNYQQHREAAQGARDRLARYLGLESKGAGNSGFQPGLEDGNSASTVTLGRDTILVMRTLYECGHEETETRQVDAEMVGLSREELQKECDGWTITEFSPGRVTMVREKAGMAPKCASTMHVGIKDNHVAIFYGTPEARCRLKSVTQIPVSGIPRAERMDLEKGIPVANKEQLLKLLEGLAESRAR